MSARLVEVPPALAPDPLAPAVAAIGSIPAVTTILEVVCRTTGMGFAAVARVTEDRWVACAVRDDIAFGLRPGDELDIGTTFCNQIRQSGREVVIDHVALDTAFCGHPIPAMYGFQSYISVPITLEDGSFFGTLCSVDPNPARVSDPAVLGMFRLFSELIARHLQAHDRLRASEIDLSNAQQAAELREQFIAVLGHDLRNPLASLQVGTESLLRMSLDERAVATINRMQNSIGRMSGLIENVLDFARGRLGGGLVLDRVPGVDLRPALEQVVAECRAASQNRPVEVRFDELRPVHCDRERVAQLLSNLLGNAMKHGAPGGRVRVEARGEGSSLELWVSNEGEPIPDPVRENLFRPFVRAASPARNQGLGLGLYIAGEIAKAHGGTLQAESGPDGTRFTFRMQA